MLRRVTDLGGTILVAVLLLPPSLVTIATVEGPGYWAPLAFGEVALVHVSLVLRVCAPLPGYALSCLAMLVAVLTPFGETSSASGPGLAQLPMLFVPSNVVFLLTLHAVCLRTERRYNLAALAVAVCGVGMASLRVAPLVPTGYPPAQYRAYLVLALFLAVLAACGIGMYQREAAVVASARRAEATRAAVRGERTRVARDIHDIVAHSLAVIVRQAEGGALLASTSPDRAATVLRTIADVGRDALRDLRGMLGVLRGPDPSDDGAPSEAPGRPEGVTSPSATLADLPTLLDRVGSAGLEVEYSEYGQPLELTSGSQLAVHHLIQEALTNTLKHAGPGATASVTVDWLPGVVVVEARDHGGRRGPGTVVPGTGVGLCGLGERLGALGGHVTARAERGGFLVRGVLPCPERRGERREVDS